MTPLYGDVALQALAGVVVAILIVGALAWAWVDLLVGAGTAEEPDLVIVVRIPVIRGAVMDEDVTDPDVIVPVPPLSADPVLWLVPKQTDARGHEVEH